MNAERKQNRRQHILEVLASELETNSGSRITTAGLAAAVGVSEAADRLASGQATDDGELYRCCWVSRNVTRGSLAF